MKKRVSRKKNSTAEKVPITIRWDSPEQVSEIKQVAHKTRRSFNAFVVNATEQAALAEVEKTK